MKDLADKNLGILWIGNIPDHWKIQSLGNVAKIILSNADKKSSSKETKVFLCNYTDVYYNNYITSNIDFLEATATDLEIERFQLKINDVLITKDSETPDDIAIPSLVIEIKKNLLCGYHLSILRPIEKKLDGSYLFFLIMSECVKSQFSSLATGITRYGLSYKHIKNISICLPPLKTQKIIASFLKRKITAIATLIAEKQRLIELLEEKRTALINQVVTKGLNPNAPMKDSGIPWIGEIPEQWQLWSVRNLIRMGSLSIQDGNHGEIHPVASDYVESGVPFIMANDVRNGLVNLETCKFINIEQAENLRIGFAQPGDILFTHKGTVGEVAVVPKQLDYGYIMLTPQVTYYRCKNNKIFRDYLSFFLRSSSFKEQIKSISSKQSTRAYIGILAQRDFLFAIPPKEEQKEIAKFLNFINQSTQKLLTSISSQIEKLQEYRRSLITAAVTGKIDVTQEKTL